MLRFFAQIPAPAADTPAEEAGEGTPGAADETPQWILLPRKPPKRVRIPTLRLGSLEASKLGRSITRGTGVNCGSDLRRCAWSCRLAVARLAGAAERGG